MLCSTSPTPWRAPCIRGTGCRSSGSIWGGRYDQLEAFILSQRAVLWTHFFVLLAPPPREHLLAALAGHLARGSSCASRVPLPPRRSSPQHGVARCIATLAGAGQ